MSHFFRRLAAARRAPAFCAEVRKHPLAVLLSPPLAGRFTDLRIVSGFEQRDQCITRDMPDSPRSARGLVPVCEVVSRWEVF